MQRKTYLYLKTHNITGLKYLGSTQNDPMTYKGNGMKWRKHLYENGNDVTTEILGEYRDREKLRKAGLYYSELWNIVKSDEYANMIPEVGGGGSHLWLRKTHFG